MRWGQWPRAVHQFPGCGKSPHIARRVFFSRVLAQYPNWKWRLWWVGEGYYPSLDAPTPLFVNRNVTCRICSRLAQRTLGAPREVRPMPTANGPQGPHTHPAWQVGSVAPTTKSSLPACSCVLTVELKIKLDDKLARARDRPCV